MAKKTAVVTVPKTKSVAKKAPRTTALPPRPEPPELKIVGKKNGGPQNDLRRAENALARVIETYKTQSEHKGNVDVDFAPFWDRLNALEAIYNEKGFTKSKRDLAYDWAGFCAEANQVEEDLFRAILENLIEKFNRMVWTSHPMLTQGEADELVAEADEKDHVRGKIWGRVNAIRKLRARGCVDLNEQPRGGRQSGGNRRGRG